MRTRMRALALALGLLLATDAAAEAERNWTPWYLPRYALAGFVSSINSDSTFGFGGRLGWEVTLINQRTNLVGTFELGPGFDISSPAPIERLYQHSFTLGVGLRPRHERQLQWGLGVGFGGILYGSHLSTGVDEQFVDGLLDARAQVGVNLGPVSLEAFFGVTQIWYVNLRKVTSPYVGGLNFGVLVDWR